MTRKNLVLLAAIFVIASPSVFAQTFVFELRGTQEVPPVSTTQSGGCMGVLDQPSATFSLTCVHDIPDATVMHIHRGASGVNGTIAHDLGSPTSPVVNTWTGMTPADIADLLAGNLYVNIHTAGRPAGVMRGQIVPRSIDNVAFTANGAQFVPPDSATETASCTADLSNDATQLAIQCTHNVASPSSAHVNEAPFGENGPVVFTFPSAASPFSANMPMTSQLVADFEATFLYLQIDGPVPVGEADTPEIRGQIGNPPASPTTGTIRIEKKSTPAGGTGFSFTDNIPGLSSFTLNDGASQTFTNVPPGVYTVSEQTTSGYTLTDLVCGDADSFADPIHRTAFVHLQAAETVVCTFTNLQTVPPTATFAFHLSGDQEVPPSADTDRGGCFGQFNSASATLSLVCTHNIVDPTVMHIHRGARGTAGPVAFDLGHPASPVEAVWSGMTPADVADLMSGNLYVNIHTSGRPGGAIRGQIVPRSIDHFSFIADGSQELANKDSLATANCNTDLSDDATSLFLQCTHDVAAPTAIHIHDAPIGVAGPTVEDFPLTNPFSGSAPMTPRLVADFEAGFLYMNIHSPAYPDGEIRGQLLPGLAAIVPAPAFSEWMLLMVGATLLLLGLWRLR